ncbi:S1C family serine protease [Halococcus saccharolyticus]|uniref:Periplasmic serine proteinase n=1 Tax=Halococcus saccharolyticus DSM 5350 TaxID=1227455 RepID=M0MDH2_9EURY|nr:trypsin-like peptidase domain-containing protein [Halococcus saccharolyticus]EMA42714.1 periplasmic serine proteinase [Halococcus saccharolyticus DSM 5350]
MDDARTTRRAYLGALGTALTAGLAGCGGALGDQTTTNATTTSSTTGDSTPAETTAGGPTNATAATADPNATGDTATATDGNATARDGNATAGDTPSPYTRVYRQTVGSVVLVSVTGGMGQGGQGSGFVFRNGYVVTNAHVVSNASTVEVRFSGGEWRSASVVGTDPSSDLAVLDVQSPPDYATPLSLVDDQAAIGTEVVAIGNPYGLEGSVTSGLVSGVNRSIPAPNGYTIPDGIQTGAPVNPGNSGGPLVNLDGEVVGVINSGGGDNLAFAISAALVERVVPSLIENGEYDHAYMGIADLQTVTPSVAADVGIDRSRGVLVRRVDSDGPSAGVLQRGDVIVGLGGQRIDSFQGLSSYLALQASPGDTIDVTVFRNGERRTLSLTLGSRPEQPGGATQSTTTP